MEYLLILIGIFMFFLLFFITTHLRPLSEDEVRSLAEKRRNKEIRMYFSFDSRKYIVNKEFKKRMNPKGKFYKINNSLFEFPAIAAELLKWKKHEWIIIAFEKKKNVDLIWINKGLNNLGATILLSAEDMVKIAKQENYTSILIFHNHPNSYPNYYDYTKPSDQDIKSAKYFAKVLNSNGINLVEFVCERGKYYEFFLSPSDEFLPLTEFIKAINKVNGESKSTNLSLHFERIFSK